MPTHDVLAAAQWCEDRIDDCEVHLAEIVAYAPFERDPDRLQCLELTHVLIERNRAKLFQRQGELLEQAKAHLKACAGPMVPPLPVESPSPPPAWTRQPRDPHDGASGAQPPAPSRLR